MEVNQEGAAKHFTIFSKNSTGTNHNDILGTQVCSDGELSYTSCIELHRDLFHFHLILQQLWSRVTLWSGSPTHLVVSWQNKGSIQEGRGTWLWSPGIGLSEKAKRGHQVCGVGERVTSSYADSLAFGCGWVGEPHQRKGDLRLRWLRECCVPVRASWNGSNDASLQIFCTVLIATEWQEVSLWKSRRHRICT